MPTFTKIQKLLHTYDPHRDIVVNIPHNNVRYGDESWSYEKRMRPDSDARAKRFFPEDIEGKTLLDFGCNEGGILLACHKLGAKKIIGLDYNEICVEKARKKSQEQGVQDATFLRGDMENRAFISTLPEVDTVFLLAILDTSAFGNKGSIIASVSRLARHAMYYEGHVNLESHVRRMYELLVYSPFTRIEYLGRFDNRILIRCSKDILKEENLAANAITSDMSDSQLMKANEIYWFTDSQKCPAFSHHCRLIQFVTRKQA